MPPDPTGAIPPQFDHWKHGYKRDPIHHPLATPTRVLYHFAPDLIPKRAWC
jgi:hypothetical protein